MFRPFQDLLFKIRELLWTLSNKELWILEKALVSAEGNTERTTLIEKLKLAQAEKNNEESQEWVAGAFENDNPTTSVSTKCHTPHNGISPIVEAEKEKSEKDHPRETEMLD